MFIKFFLFFFGRISGLIFSIIEGFTDGVLKVKPKIWSKLLAESLENQVNDREKRHIF